MEIQKVLHLHKAKEKKTSRICGEYIVSEKLDGNYVYADYAADTERWSCLRSSSHRIIPALDHIDFNILSRKCNKGSARLIFEATHPDMNFYELNGLLNRKTNVNGVHLNLHDIVYKNTALTAVQRLGEVYSFCSYDINVNTAVVKCIKHLDISSDEVVWQQYFENIIAKGGEGVVLKQADSYYRPGKRDESLLKIKEEVTVDLLCLGIEPTIGKKGEPSLSLKCRRGSGAIITVVVPKDSDQIRFTNNPETIIGKVVEIKAMKELPNGMLREPRFKRLRLDKLISEID